MTTDCVGGVWTYSLDLARELGRSGAEVVLATMGAPLTADQRAAAETAGLASLHESEFALEWMDAPWDEVDAAGDWLLELAAAESVDVVHSNSFSHGALDWRRPVVVVGHSCVVSWWRAVHGHDPPPEWDEYRRRVTAGLRGADALVAPTRAMLAELESAYGASGMVIHNGSSAPEIDAPKEPFILAAGRLWDPAKGLDLLDAAGAGLDWPILAAGESERPAPRESPVGKSASAAPSSESAAPASESAVPAPGSAAPASTSAAPASTSAARASATDIRALGRLAPRELARLRERASIFVAPARYEPFGLGILEAARAGCALVLADIPSLRELWSGAAAFADPRDARALNDAVAALIADSDERRRLARAARMHARRYSAERMARGYARLYERLLSPGKWGVTPLSEVPAA
jgi:glycogen synthase